MPNTHNQVTPQDIALERVLSALLCMQRYSWEQGFAAQAFLELGHWNLVICAAYEAVNRQTEDGRLANIGSLRAVTDPMSMLEPLLRAWEVTGDAKLKTALDKALEWALHTAPRSDTGIVYHVEETRQLWVDSMYMLPPGLLAAGHAAEAVKQMDGYIAALYDREACLFRHIWSDAEQRFIRPVYWGVGNGWALCGLTRLIAGLPEAQENARARYIALARETIEAALAHRRADGLFGNILDDLESFMEVNFAQMLCYAIAKGVQSGYLPAPWQETAQSLRDAVYPHVSEYGLVRNVCGAPSFGSPGIAPEGQAAFLLMESCFH